MKILAIRIKNLAPLEGVTEIDFTSEPLSSAGIFAITGATGAGKSTILDALCLALYGKTPRYLQAKEIGIEIKDVEGSTLNQGDVRSILRDGTADGFAQVDFVGIDEQYHRATWSVRRARNKADGSMQSDSVTLKNITTNTDFPAKKAETLNEIARLVGLNFDQFTRSVLLAQGDFTAFMKADKGEKASLLEKLTGTYIYSEISKKIYEKFRGEEMQLRDLNLRKEGIITLSEEELKALSDEQDILEIEIKSLEKEIEILNAEIGWYEQLAKLQINYDLAYTALDVATEVQSSALPRKQKLKTVEQAQQTKSWADALKYVQEQHADKTTALAQIKANLAVLQKEKERLENQLDLAETNLSEKNKALTDALPLLEQARRLDTLLEEKKQQVEKLKEEAENSVEANSQHQILLATKQEEFTILADQIKDIADWKAENKDRSPIAENKDIILSKLQDAQQSLEILQQTSAILAQIQDKIDKDEATRSTIESNWKQQVNGLEILKKNYELLSKELLLTPIETLGLDKSETDRKVEYTIKAQAHWQLFYGAFTELKALDQKQLKDKSDLQTKQETLKNLAQQLPLEKAQRDTAQQLLQQARLASTENVETLREALVDDEPCPVCGSKSHPYALHNPQLENVLVQLEKSFEEKDQSFHASNNQYIALEQESKMLQQNIECQSEEITTRQQAVASRKQSWEQFDIAEESRAIADAEKAAWIEEKLQDLKIKQSDLQLQIQTYTEKKQQIEAAKTQIDQLKENTDGLGNQIKDIQNQRAVYQEQQGSYTRDHDKANSDLDSAEQILSPYFTTPNWMKNWKTAPIAFVERIENFARDWKVKTERMEQYIRQNAALEATLNQLENQAKTLASDVNKKMEAHIAENKLYLALYQERNSIFGGLSASETETTLKQAINDAQQQLEQLKITREQLNINSTKAQTQYDELAASITALQAEAQKESEKMQLWLDDFNSKNNQSLNMDALHDLLSLSNDWMATERGELQTIDEEVTKAISVLSERKHALDTHKENSVSDRPVEELSELHTIAKSALEDNKHKKGENSFRLQQDAVNKQRIGDLMQHIAAQEAINEKWSKLNEIIGSADGKKFRQIAQEYTLDVLLGYANIHLQALTNRYKIERIPLSLALQVVDQDMGDEVRTVYSLSGGESFLVSLALALGLASLSSSRMKVESLFIDEGFGSLDPNTLNIAMDALERLHNQGRKVGVISHVQEMTERIPVQIKVSKQQSGKSMVEVIGN
ncbi:AAA family ATPase [Sphingobacterium paramultivorum]|uniref:AAA family ATPase n=1 Tax=Sphingobacterium paramultivorum TaxID=2886510 RepID=UPI00129C477F|nr:SbcC/MukB-like Walker B domain-containing protein [Sphingobacterium paramultivorum]